MESHCDETLKLEGSDELEDEDETVQKFIDVIVYATALARSNEGAQFSVYLSVHLFVHPSMFESTLSFKSVSFEL